MVAELDVPHCPPPYVLPRFYPSLAIKTMFAATDRAAILTQWNGSGCNVETAIQQKRGDMMLADNPTQHLADVGTAAMTELNGIILAFKTELAVQRAEDDVLRAELEGLLQNVHDR